MLTARYLFLLGVLAGLATPLLAASRGDWKYDCPSRSYSKNVSADNYDVGKINYNYYSAPAFNEAYFIVYGRALRDQKTGYTLYKFYTAGRTDTEVYYVVDKKHTIVSRFLGSPSTSCERHDVRPDELPRNGS